MELNVKEFENQIQKSETEVVDDNVANNEEQVVDTNDVETEVEHEEPEESVDEPKAEIEEEPETVDEPTNNVEEEPENDDDVFQGLSNEVGIDIKSEDDIVSSLKSYKELIEDPEIKGLIEYKKAGGDVSEYYRLKSIVPDKLETKQLLEQSFMLKNEKLASQNPNLAKMRFEKEFKSRYNLIQEKQSLSGEELDEWLVDNAEELKLQEEELAYEQSEAKEAITQWQTQRTSPQKQAVNEDDLAEKAQRYIEQAEQAVSTYNGFKVQVEKDKHYNVVLDDQTKQIAHDYLVEPMKFLQEHLGLGEDGRIDPNKALSTISKVLMADRIGKNIAEFAMEEYNRKTIESQVENPPKEKTDGTARTDVGEKSKGQLVAEAMSKIHSNY